MKRSFSICVFLLILGVAAAQQPTNNSPDSPNIATSAFEKLKSQAEKGDIEAEAILGWDYLYGDKGIAQDTTQGVKWTLKAAERGDVISQHNIGYCYGNGFGVAKDLAESFKCIGKNS